MVDLKSAKNPLATVCNYVFDSLRQDAFRVKEKTLYENRVTITATKPLPADKSKGLGLKWSHRAHAVTPERARAYYARLETGAGDGQQQRQQQEGKEEGERGEGEEALISGVRGDSDFDGLLLSYLEGRLGEAGGSLLMPLGALRLLRHLSSLSGGRGLVLVGDKGYLGEEEMVGERDPHIAYHGSLSCMVNLDALARYTRQKGGWSVSSPYMEGFKCQALAFGVGKGALQETRLAFEDSTQSFGPESFSTLQRAVKDDVAQPSLALVMQLLRLSRLDPDVFMKFRAPLVDQVSSHELPPPLWEDLKNDALSIAQQWYPLQQGKDVHFEAARLLMALKDFQAALALFRRSNSVSGEHHVTSHNMGMSYFYLGKLKQAQECFERSIELDQNYKDSVRWLAHVQRSMVPPAVAAATGGGDGEGEPTVSGVGGSVTVSELRDAEADLTFEDRSAVGGVADTVNLNTLSI
eukprot:jgi/Undpi1/12148/HiC_scaffold_5.g01824.m1